LKAPLSNNEIARIVYGIAFAEPTWETLSDEDKDMFIQLVEIVPNDSEAAGELVPRIASYGVDIEISRVVVRAITQLHEYNKRNTGE
tara:strand:+ start:89 stop:349 length:261 start_codon:yes stop_codon:yes gene_type:complete